MALAPLALSLALSPFLSFLPFSPFSTRANAAALPSPLPGADAVVLIDNGSLRAASALSLRRVATTLAARLVTDAESQSEAVDSNSSNSSNSAPSTTASLAGAHEAEFSPYSSKATHEAAVSAWRKKTLSSDTSSAAADTTVLSKKAMKRARKKAWKKPGKKKTEIKAAAKRAARRVVVSHADVMRGVWRRRTALEPGPHAASGKGNRALPPAVTAASLRFTDALPSAALGDVPGEVVAGAVARLAAHTRTVRLVPFFLGPSEQLPTLLPKLLAPTLALYPSLRVALAPPLVDLTRDPPDLRLAAALVDHVRQAVAQHLAVSGGSGGKARMPPSGRWPVVVVDHGSPSRSVTAVRDRLALEVARLLGAVDDTSKSEGTESVTAAAALHRENTEDTAALRHEPSPSSSPLTSQSPLLPVPSRSSSAVRFGPVVAASMERRPARAYDFCDPLLENVFGADVPASGPVIIAMAFLSPGRHAGAGGDVAEIVAEAQRRLPGLGPILVTELLGAHPVVVDILVDRCSEAITRPWLVLQAGDEEEGCLEL